MADGFNQLAYRNSLRSIADDYVIYDLETEEAYTTNGLDLAEIAGKLGFNSRESDDFATKVYMAEFGSPFEFKGKKYIVWNDEFEGWHHYHASTKKSEIKKSDDVLYEVHTANEDGWTDYHEEDDETDDFEVALDWITRDDVKWGEISVNGKTVAWSDDEHNVEYADGWGPRGKMASTKKSKPTFTEQVNKQRDKNNGIAKDGTIGAIYDDVSEIRQKILDVISSIFELDWNQYDMRGYPQKLGDAQHALSQVLEDLEIQFDL